MALLAALPQAPSRFNPERNSRSAIARRNYVIQRMLEDGYVTKAEADEAKAAPLGVKPPPPYISVGAEYFVEEVRREMLAKHGEDKMKAGGFVIRSTLDPKMQAFADAALRRGLVAARLIEDHERHRVGGKIEHAVHVPHFGDQPVLVATFELHQ